MHTHANTKELMYGKIFKRSLHIVNLEGIQRGVVLGCVYGLCC